MRELTLLPAATHADRLALQEAKKRMRMTAISGRKCLELLHRRNPLGAFSKMFMVMSPWDWTKCLLTWKAEATPHNRILFRLWATEQTIDGTEFLLSPTPQAMDAMKARPAAALEKQMDGARKNRTRIGTMKDVAVYGLKWTGTACRQGEGELSPRRLEWMMNFPDGWTETEC